MPRKAQLLYTSFFLLLGLAKPGIGSQQNLFSDWSLRLDEDNTGNLPNGDFKVTIDHGGHGHNRNSTSFDQYNWKIYDYNHCSDSASTPKAYYLYDGAIKDGPFETTFESTHQEFFTSLTVSLKFEHVQESGMWHDNCTKFCVRFELLFDGNAVTHLDHQFSIPALLSSEFGGNQNHLSHIVNTEDVATSRGDKWYLITIFCLILGIIFTLSIVLSIFFWKTYIRNEGGLHLETTLSRDKTKETKFSAATCHVVDAQTVWLEYCDTSSSTGDCENPKLARSSSISNMLPPNSKISR